MRSSALLAVLAWTGCITPSVIESSGRVVELAPKNVAWRPALPADLRGLFQSESIEGEAAAVLQQVLYYFAADGRFSGAALVLGEQGPEFQTLGGTFTLHLDQLDLDLDFGDGSLARVTATEDRLRLESEGNVVILRRVGESPR